MNFNRRFDCFSNLTNYVTPEHYLLCNKRKDWSL